MGAENFILTEVPVTLALHPLTEADVTVTADGPVTSKSDPSVATEEHLMSSENSVTIFCGLHPGD